MDQHIPTNNKITGDKPSQQLFPKQVATQLSYMNQTNRTHRGIKIKTFTNWIASNIKQMKPQRNYRLGTASNNYGGGGGGGFEPVLRGSTFTLIFRCGLHN